MGCDACFTKHDRRRQKDVETWRCCWPAPAATSSWLTRCDVMLNTIDVVPRPKRPCARAAAAPAPGSRLVEEMGHEGGRDARAGDASSSHVARTPHEPWCRRRWRRCGTATRATARRARGGRGRDRVLGCAADPPDRGGNIASLDPRVMPAICGDAAARVGQRSALPNKTSAIPSRHRRRTRGGPRSTRVRPAGQFDWPSARRKPTFCATRPGSGVSDAARESGTAIGRAQTIVVSKGMPVGAAINAPHEFHGALVHALAAAGAARAGILLRGRGQDMTDRALPARRPRC